MVIVNSNPGGFYTERIGATAEGLPVYLYFDSSSGQFRPVVVPLVGNPHYANPETVIRHDSSPVSPLASAVVLGTLGALLGGPVGAAAGALIGGSIGHWFPGNGSGTAVPR